MKVLFVTPYVPYPLNNGGLIRVHHLAANIARRHEVVMICMEPDNDGQATGIKVLEEKGITVLPQPVAEHQKKHLKRRYQLKSLFLKKTYQFFQYYSKDMQNAVDQQLASKTFDLLMVEFSQMGYYQFNTEIPRFVDQHNVEYEIMQRTFQTEKNPLRKLLAHSEWRKYRVQEIENCNKFTDCLTTSKRDAEILQERSPNLPCHVVPNGVDSDFFTPAGASHDANLVLFTGTISYYPNTEGLIYFIKNIWPLIIKQNPSAQFCIAGKGPPVEIEKLAAQDSSIIVTGMVDDMRDYYAKAAVVVVPLRVGGGTRLKILEAMAMQKAIVSTSIGAEGIAHTDGNDILLEDTPQDFANAVIKVMNDDTLRSKLELGGRVLVESQYDWRAVSDRLCDIFEETVDTQDAAA